MPSGAPWRFTGVAADAHSGYVRATGNGTATIPGGMAAIYRDLAADDYRTPPGRC